MGETIKRYEIKREGLTSITFEKAGFRKKDSTDEHKHGTYYFSEVLLDGIEVQIEIDAFYPFAFDDSKNVTVYDKTYERVFTAFYDEDRDYGFKRDLIKEYNKTMDSLVDKGVFKPKVQKKGKTLINK